MAGITRRSPVIIQIVIAIDNMYGYKYRHLSLHISVYYVWYNTFMTLTKTTPFTKEEIQQLREQFDSYIKTVIDIEKKICSAGCDRHFESEKILLDQGSKQEDIWGGGIDLETKTIDGNSFINIRPTQGNTSNEIQDPIIRKSFEEITKYFFNDIYGK